MAVPNEVILKKMATQISKAQIANANSDHQQMLGQIAKLQLLCELLLEPNELVDAPRSIKSQILLPENIDNDSEPEVEQNSIFDF